MIQDPYKKLGLRRVINAATCLTRLGGSIPHPSVYRAMEQASKSFVQIPELQHWAGKTIAEAKPHPGDVQRLEELPDILNVHV